MPIYTVKDNESGKTIKFQWNGDGQPTESDISEIIGASGSSSQESKPSLVKNAVEDVKDIVTGIADVAGKVANPIKTGIDVGRDAARVYDENESIMDSGRGAREVIGQGIIDPAKAAVGAVGESIMHPVETFQKRPVSTALDILGLVGGGASATARLAGKAGKIRVAPFAGKVDFGVVKAANDLGIDLPASAMSKSPAVNLIETYGAKGFFGENIVQKVEMAGNKLNEIADKVISETGKSPDLSSAGKAISDGTKKYRDNFLKVKEFLYKKAALPEGIKKPLVVVDPVETRKFVNVILKDKTNAEEILGKSTDIGYFKTLSDNVQGNISAKYLRSAIRELNSKIENFNDPVATGNKGTLKKLVASMSDDLDVAIKTQRPDLAEAIDRANAFYQEGIEKLNSSWGQKIEEFKEQPDKILPAIMNPSTSIEDIPKIFEVAGKESIPQIQSSVMNQLFEGSRNPATGNFRPQGLSAQLKRYGEDKLQAILSPEQFKTIKNVEEVAKGLGRGQKIAEGSQTAFIARMAVELGTVFVNPLLPLKALLGDAVFTKFIASKAGQKFLTEGFTFNNPLSKIPENAGRATTGLLAPGEMGQ